MQRTQKTPLKFTPTHRRILRFIVEQAETTHVHATDKVGVDISPGRYYNSLALTKGQAARFRRWMSELAALGLITRSAACAYRVRLTKAGWARVKRMRWWWER